MSFELLLIPAFISGLVMFISPCTYPLLPGYIAFIGGTGEQEKASKWKIVGNSIFFLIGFSLVFIVFGVLAGLVGSKLASYQIVLRSVGGVAIIIFALSMLKVIKLPQINFRARNLTGESKRGTKLYSFLTGLTFSLGWSPCVGPILGSIFFLAATSTSILQGGVLLLIFSLGFSLPFLALAVGLEYLTPYIKKTEKFSGVLQTIGGVLLLILGILFLFNGFEIFSSWFTGLFENLDGGYKLFERFY
jgi:cytochrome c-type biogenesis protein